ncbi:MAG: adenylyltransferase/cytidyltransferase family protein [bacterium]
MSSKPLKKVFVSGCYDILHGGHIHFFQQARALGDHLTVCFASEEVLLLAKKRKPSLPDSHKMVILSSLRCVDMAVSSSDIDPVFDFRTHITHIQPAILAVTEDDKNVDAKRIFCSQYGIEVVVLKKDTPLLPVSTTSIITSIQQR